MPRKQSLKCPLRRSDRLAGQQHNPQSITAFEIPDGQWFHPSAIAGAIPPFKIHRPDIMAVSGLPGSAPLEQRPAQTSTFASAQSPTPEPPADGCHRRRSLLTVALHQPMPDLARSPRRSALAQSAHPAQPVGPCLSGTGQRPMRTILQTSEPALSVAAPPFIGRLSGDVKATCQFTNRQFSSAHQPHQIKPLFLFTSIFPRHAPWKLSAISCAQCVNYLLSPCLAARPNISAARQGSPTIGFRTFMFSPPSLRTRRSATGAR